ncbi:hypothetical protein TNCV_2612231 [Trichonephila clavipes]|nr:hypothetical protein TNCV_2612231 [Trichonephila clavipes]
MLIQVFVLTVHQTIETSIVEVCVKVLKPHLDGLLNLSIGSDVLIFPSVASKGRRDRNHLMRGLDCKKGGPITPNENIISSSRTSVLLSQIPCIKTTPIFVT